MNRRTWLTLTALVAALLLLSAVPILAQEGGDKPQPPSDAYCLLCHSQPDQTWTLPSGETLSLTIDPSILAGSVHGEGLETPVHCADCHIDQRFPHEVQSVQTAREFRLQRYASCRTCHEDQYTRAQDSVHGEALRSGELAAAVCVDCHGAHDIQSSHEPRSAISLTCGRCHGAIFDQYRDSVHGVALFDEDNPDVPTCIDCHGVHDIQNPTTSLFRVRSPELCATCHANSELMDQYGISTNVFNSYLTDFHGSTVALFEQQDPTTPTNKAVCYDCHGVHNIQAVGDGETLAIRENLLETCRECHPDATADFPDAWIGHYAPTAETAPQLLVANGVNAVVLPVVLGLFGILLVVDLIGRVRRRITRPPSGPGA